jgi:hypothetical protein
MRRGDGVTPCSRNSNTPGAHVAAADPSLLSNGLTARQFDLITLTTYAGSPYDGDRAGCLGGDPGADLGGGTTADGCANNQVIDIVRSREIQNAIGDVA